MTVDPDSQDAKAIRQLIPVSRIAISRFNELCDLISVEELESGNFLFKRDDNDNTLLYILQGSICLQTEEFKVETIEATSDAAKFPLAHQIPRKIDALAETDIRFLRLQRGLFESELDSPKLENGKHMIEDEIEENDDWMTTLLKSPIFRALPPANLQRILMELEAISVVAGENIIEQGAEGDYYYLIKSGRCLITRKPSPTSKEIKLAELKNQDTFGEDALLSGAPRNVTVKAVTDVSLLRLNKENFINLIKQPSLKFINLDEARQQMEKGAVLLDVRSVDEFKKAHLDNSINVPFFSLRMYLKTFNKSQTVIVVCDDGNTSEAAAFLLLRNKIEAFILQGGMSYLEKEVAQKQEAAIVEHDSSNASVVEKNEEKSLLVGDDSNGEDESRQTILLLEKKCAQLTEEKEDLMRKYKMLYKQMEKMKSVLDALRNEKK